MNPLSSILARFPLMILDGAFATELEARGCDLNDPLWSARVLVENPGLIEAVHQDYFAAGADCVITASYQATLAGFAARGLSMEEGERLLRLSVELARKARDDFWRQCSAEEKARRPAPLVAASIGPYGAFLADGAEYRGDYAIDAEELYHFHRRRLALLVSARPDILACETIPCLAEAKAVVRCLEEHPTMSGWVSFSCRDGLHVRNGERVADCARWLDRFEQVAAIGVNCTEPQFVVSLIGEIRSATEKPVVVYPNSGEQYDLERKCWLAGSGVPAFWRLAAEWVQAGATVIGGCCRTSPRDIRDISEHLRPPGR